MTRASEQAPEETAPEWDFYYDEEEEEKLTEEEEESMEFAVALAEAADEAKAMDLSVLHVAPLVRWTSFFVMCTIYSRPQMEAVVERMDEVARERFGRAKVAPSEEGEWTVIDMSDVVVHILTPEQRSHYALDEQYGDAAQVELPFEPASTPLS